MYFFVMEILTRNHIQAAGQEALRSGVSVMALGVGGSVNSQELDGLVTKPSCRHHLAINSFPDLQYFVQLTQRTICNGGCRVFVAVVTVGVG